MTVSELMAQLRSVDPNRLVIAACDAEGNGYSQIHFMWECTYEDGEVHHEALTDELRQCGYTEADVKPGAPAVCLVPV